MQVINVRGLKPNDPSVIYCGRDHAGWEASPLGNPCSARGKPCPVCGLVHFAAWGTQVTPCRSLPCYRKWLWEKIRTRDRVVLDTLRALSEDSVLGCWCKPKPCHAEVIASAWAWCVENGVFS